MSVFASLHTSSQAMMTQSHVMERISGNVANINTTGYKSFNAHLQDSVNHINTKGTFLTVDAVDVRQADKQGIIQSTGRDLDVAINGQGFFITNPAFDGTGTQHFTRNGSTGMRVADDGNAYLTTLDGQYFMGWSADATDADGTIDTTQPLAPIQVNSADSLPGAATTAITYAANVDAGSTTGHTFESRVWSNPDETGKNDPYALVMTWQPRSDELNTWTVSYSVRDPLGATTTLADTTTVAFGGTGRYLTPTEDITVTVPFADGTDTTVTLDLTGMTQYGDTGFQEHYQDANGYPDGTLAGVSFDVFGQLTARYSNGEARVLSQLALADFPAPQNLLDAGSTMFTYRVEAGEPDIFAVTNTLARTAIIPGSLEGSTVDLAQEFTTMITTQKAYSSSATVYRSSDEMIRTATDLKQ
ncbi:flagellar hook-basal body complex protein [Roseospira visakhapatnamensis]|uniref:Flagellar hook protein FlgE n=1 Tax=Roseospira visakhapatnamensis TaxID=390880 RepID=A0A7W6WAF5_9PROT|nr:flagellar hook-basal body complex protein [Roseospira visakhapatnamensis]MBB4267140.1 flagellar hook protein FlgE [Roseospira visakhapatnamensis]